MCHSDVFFLIYIFLFSLLFTGRFLPELESPLKELTVANPLRAAMFSKWEIDTG